LSYSPTRGRDRSRPPVLGRGRPLRAIRRRQND